MTEYTWCETREELSWLWKQLRKHDTWAYDIETNGLDAYTNDVLLMQFYNPAVGVVLVPAYKRGTHKALPHLLDALSQNTVIGHNLRFEYQFALVKHNVRLVSMWDTQLAESVLTAGRLGVRTDLGSTLLRRCRVTASKELQKSWVGQAPEGFVPSDEQLEYASKDVAYMFALRNAQHERLFAENLVRVHTIECRAIPAFAQMELEGLELDEAKHVEVITAYEQQQESALAYCQTVWGAAYTRWATMVGGALGREFGKRSASVQARLWRKKSELPAGYVQAGTPEAKALYQWRDRVKPKKEYTFNLGSKEQALIAARMLKLNRAMLPDLKKPTVVALTNTLPEGPSKEALVQYRLWRAAMKVTSTYGYSMSAKRNPVTGRIHPHYNQLVSTGRTSSKEPNGQNMPPAIRHCFVAGAGQKFVIADFAAMELRILAAMSGDDNMLRAFNEGIDLHKFTAWNAYRELFASWEEVPDKPYRAQGKTANFGFIYGGSAYGLWKRGVVPSLEVGERLQAGYQVSYPQAWEYIQECGWSGLRQGYAETATGRRRYFPPLGQPPENKESEEYIAWAKRRGGIRRQSMNHPIQGTGADIAKLAMTTLESTFYTVPQSGAKLVGMVHDELLVRCNDDWTEWTSARVLEAMAEAGQQLFTNVTMTADVHVADVWSKD